MKRQVCKLWPAGIINTEIRLLEHFQTLNIYQLYADSSAAGISATVKCPRWLYQSQCEFSVRVSAGMRSGAGDGVSDCYETDL